MKKSLMIALLLVAALGCRRKAEAPAAAEGASGTGTAQTSGGEQNKFPALGTEVPSFVLNQLDGRQVDLASMKGKVVLVNLWATWCGPCRAEIPAFVQLYDKQKAHGFEILGISVDSEGSEETIRSFMAQEKINYPVLFDPAGKSTELFETSVIPTSALLDRQGRVVWFGRGTLDPTDPDFSSALRKALGEG